MSGMKTTQITTGEETCEIAPHAGMQVVTKTCDFNDHYA